LFVGAPRNEENKKKVVHPGDINFKSGREKNRVERGEKWGKMEKDDCNIANSLFSVEYQRRIE
jgi:hypothetical protein